ncbi:MAG: hypothetical protein AAF264_03600 [Pseudomonadota bacterium]
MTHTLDTLLAALDDLDPALAVSFAGSHGATQGDWHVTRITLADLSHVDCDGGRATDRETVVEVLDGPPGRPMTILRLASILAKGRAALPGSGAAPLHVFHGSVRSVVDGIDGGTIRLAPVHAVCRPAARIGCCA